MKENTTKTIKLLPKDSHWYMSPKHKGVYYPSVTYVTSFLPKGAFFEKYLADQESYEESRKILQDAGLRGTRCHIASEVLDRGGEISYGESDLTDEEFGLMMGYVAWHQKYKPEIIHIELVLVSDKQKIGGTCDRIYRIDGKLTLFDLKTSKSAIYDSHYLQVACYASLYEEIYREKIDEIAILRLTSKRKDGYEYVVRSRKEWLEDYKQFKKTYDTMLYLNGGKLLTPKIMEVPEILKL